MNKIVKKERFKLLLFLGLLSICLMLIGMYKLTNTEFEISSNSRKTFLAEPTISQIVGMNVNATFDSTTGEVTISSTSDTGTIVDFVLEAFWNSCGKENIKTITFANEVYAPNISTQLFQGLTELVTINNINYLNTSRVTQMNYMFYNCKSLKTLDLHNWDTSVVEATNSMFANCRQLTSIIGLENFKVEKVTEMSYMFYNCKSLKTLDLNNWNTSNVKDMEYMFNGCNNLTTLELNNWNTSNVINMRRMFMNCSSLTTLNLSNWDMSNVTNVDAVLYECTALEEIYAPSKLPTGLSIFLPAQFINTNNLEEKATILSTSAHLFKGIVISFDFGEATNYILPEYDKYKSSQGKSKSEMSNKTDLLPKAILWDEENLNNETGYKFAGWKRSDNGEIIDIPYVDNNFNTDITYTATFEEITYTIKYDGNGNTTGNTNNSIHKYNEEKTLNKNGYSREYTVTFSNNYEGADISHKTAKYNFIGWSEEKGKEKLYNDEQNVVKLTKGKTKILYAVWKASTVSVIIPTREGYKFEGWYKEAECQNKVMDINAKEYTPENNITLYAKWTPIGEQQNGTNNVANQGENKINTQINNIPNTGDILPIAIGVVIILVIVVNVVIIIIKKKKNTNKDAK